MICRERLSFPLREFQIKREEKETRSGFWRGFWFECNSHVCHLIKNVFNFYCRDFQDGLIEHIIVW